MKKVVIAIALMLATSASWAGGTLTAAATVFGATPMLGSTKTSNINVPNSGYGYVSGKLYKADGTTAVAAPNTTVTCYLIDLGTSVSDLVDEFATAYKNNQLVIDYEKEVWYNSKAGLGSATASGAANRLSAKTDSSSAIGAGTTLGRTSVDTEHYYAIVIFTDDNKCLQNEGNTTTGFHITGIRAGSKADSSYSFNAAANMNKTISEFGGDSAASSKDYGAANAGWYIPAAGGSVHIIPEPTSGLMILIGIASLALKRKRA